MRRVPITVRLSLVGFLLHGLPMPVSAQETPSTGNTAVAPAPREGAWQGLHEKFLGQARQGGIDVLFLGDSITQGWNDNPIWQRFYGPRHAANFGIGGDRTQHVLWRLGHGEIEGIKPKVVVLMIGTNNIGSNSPDEIAGGITTIVETLRKKLPETKVLLLGVFPRGKSRSQDLMEDEQDPRVEEINSKIAKLGEREGVTYLDIGRKFLNADGKIPRDVMPDFLHLSRKGYRAWADAIEPTLWKLTEE